MTDGSVGVRVSHLLAHIGARRSSAILWQTANTLCPATATLAISGGQAFYGQVEILGKPYETGYEPIKDAAGSPIGIYYVGYKMP